MSFRSLRFKHNERLGFAALNSPAMKKGEKGHPVRLVQQALIDLGYPMPVSTAKYGSPDGVFGSESKAKVRKFQRDKKLDVDGAVGKQTLGKMDELLVGKPAQTLPDIPGPGGDKKIDVNAELVIRDVLSASILSSVNFTLEYSQKSRMPDHEDTRPNPVVATHRVYFNGRNFIRVAEAVSDGTIAVQSGASSHTAAQYIPNNLVSGYPADTILIGRELNVWAPNDRSLIVHEGAHAVCDLQNIRAINAVFSEMIAFMAEAYYRQLTGLGPKRGVFGTAAVIYQSSDAAVKFYRKGQTPPDYLLDEIWFAIVASHHDFVDSQVVYDGV